MLYDRSGSILKFIFGIKTLKYIAMKNIWVFMGALLLVISCKNNDPIEQEEREESMDWEPSTVETVIGPLFLPAPYSSQSIRNTSEVIGWPENVMPRVPPGFVVSLFAKNLEHPRWAYMAPNNDVFVAESNTENSADQITLLRDVDHDGDVDERHVFATGLNQNLGMLILEDHFYVANTDALYRFPYVVGDTLLRSPGEKIADLPAGGYNNHWTRNIISNFNGDKIYVSVGSGSNVGENGMENEARRANILEMNPDGGGEIIYADGLRNPVGMDWNPITGELWAAVNERDELGDDLVPDYVTSVQKGGWYGWPYSYYGQVNDPNWVNDPHQELVDKAIVPDVPVGNHTASLGLTFYTSDQFPERYRNGAFVGQHGSWNKSQLAGYKVIFIPFVDGKPQPPEDFLTGFIASEVSSQVYGRPVGVIQGPNGSLLVCDDDGNRVWQITAQ